MADNYGKVTIGATGDILLHKRVYEKARQKDGSFDFTDMFENVKHLFKEEELIIVNQESIIAGEELGLSFFPRFNSPVEIGYQLKNLNVDLVNIANNHTLDRGEKGVLKSIENWEKIGLPYVGAYKSWEDHETIRIFHKNGIRLCFLSFNAAEGIRARMIKGKEYLLNNYSQFSYRGIKASAGLRRLINQIKRRNLADVMIVSMHFGREYLRRPTSKQQELSHTIAEAGADIIIGHHTHVLHPPAYITTSKGTKALVAYSLGNFFTGQQGSYRLIRADIIIGHHPHVLQPPAYITTSQGKKVFVAYSLGNFFTGQQGIYRQIGAYMELGLRINYEKNLYERIEFFPSFKLTFVDSKDRKDYTIYLLKDMLEKSDTIKTSMGEFTSKEIYSEMRKHMRKWIPDLDII